MANFTIEVKGLDETLKRFGEYGHEAEEAVWAGIQRTGFEVTNKARETVHKVTSTLARSIGITDENRRDLSLKVSTNVEYAAAEEFGLRGPQPVRQHQRTIHKAFGRPIAVTLVNVSAHTRYMNRPPHPYMGPAAAYGQDRIGPNVNAELEALTL